MVLQNKAMPYFYSKWYNKKLQDKSIYKCSFFLTNIAKMFLMCYSFVNFCYFKWKFVPLSQKKQKKGRIEKMNYNKLKRFACVAMATVMTFGTLQIQPSEAQAATTDTTSSPIVTEGSSYEFFADAVKAMYDGKTDQVSGDYGLASFDNNYEYSVAKKDVRTCYSANNLINSDQASQSCLWSIDTVNSMLQATLPSSIKYLEHRKNVSITSVTSTQEKVQNNWDYDVVDLTVHHQGSAGGEKNYGKVAVNIRPSSPIQGSVTLPAYLNDSKYGVLSCVELGDGAFLKNEKLTAVYIPSTYQRICAYAFTGCTNLQTISLVTTTTPQNGADYTITDASAEENMKNSNLHFLGTGAFAGCKGLKNAILPEALLEGYMYTDNNEIKGFAGSTSDGTIDYQSCTYISSNTKLIVSAVNTDNSQVIKSGNAVRYGTYFMGQGVYRDCYELDTVELSGKNPYIPAATFAGCSKIKDIKIADSVENITFGPASFAGADGNRTPNEKSSLKSLELTSPNLKSVNIGAYAFKNCCSLKTVTIKALLNPQKNMSTEVQNTKLTTNNAFENSFAPGGTFIYEPSSVSGNYYFVLYPEFFKNCINLEKISIMENLKDNKDIKAILSIGENAFEGVGCKEILLDADEVRLFPGSMYGLTNTDTLILSGAMVTLRGEPFSNSLKYFKTTSNTSLKKIQIDGETVVFAPHPHTDKTYTSEKNKIYITTRASFYGVGSKTTLEFTENVTKIGGCVDNVSVNSVTSEDGTHDYYHCGLGELSKIYFKGYSTTFDSLSKVFAAPLTNYSSTEYTDVNKDLKTTIYADGDTYNALSKLETLDNSHLTLSSYFSAIGTNSMEWVEGDKEFRPENLNDGKGLKIQYADGVIGYVGYSTDKMESGEPDSRNGFVINNLAEATKNIKAGDKITLSVTYRGKVGMIEATVVPRKVIDMDVTPGTSAVYSGAVPKITDVQISSIKFNDTTSSDTIPDPSEVSISLAEGTTYKAGENIVNVTYMGCTKQVTVNAETEKVVSMSAIQAKKTVYPGDTLTNDDFTVTAYYNSGRIAENYTDFTIENPEVLANTTSVKLTNTDGAEQIVELSVSTLKAISLMATYTGSAVSAGTELQKKDFAVSLVFENGTTKTLDEAEYMLLYDGIADGVSNKVEVIYKLDSAIRTTVYVLGAGIVPVETNNPTDPTIPTEPIASDGTLTTNAPVTTPVSTPGNGIITTPNETPVVTATVVPSEAPGNPVNVNNNTVPNAVTTGGAIATPDVNNGLTLKNTKTTLTLGVGEKIKIAVSNATYQSSDASIVSIANDGTVTAHKVGTAEITVTKQDGNTMTCTVVVKKAPKKVKINFTKKTLKKGKKAKIKVSFAKGYFSRTNTFKSSNKKVAAVNKSGLILAKKKGSCKITVIAYNGKKATIKIKVK